MKRIATTAAAVTLLMLIVAAPATASPTCAEQMGIAVHGQHVISDYVVGDHSSAWPPSGAEMGSALRGVGAQAPGAPGAKGHIPAGIAPGASFCNAQAQSPGFHFP